jgi:hypothetical protein
MIRRLLALSAAALAALLFSNCTSSSGIPATYDASSANVSRYGAMPEAPAPAAMRRTSPPKDRPGLATEYGGRLDDKISTTVFDRDSNKPVGVAKLFYNDQAGASAMAGHNWSYANSFRDYAGGIFRVGLRNHRGAALSAYQSGDNLICVGEGGQRYSIEVENLSNHRLEFVVTVDGLDVLSGQGGSFSHRGYVLDPGESREIRGWRTSDKEVAAFKFGDVSDSYVGRTTRNTQNVGVIGTAVFAERGTSPKPYAGTDTYRRMRADPFVASPSGNRYAPPPPQR